VVWIGWREGGVSHTLFVGVGAPRSIPADIALGAAAAALLIGLWALALRFSVLAQRLDETLAQHVGGLSADRLVAVALLSGFAEELFFRGALQGSVGLGWASLIFGLCHLGPVREARWWAGFAGFAGVLLGGLAAWRESLLAPIVAHCMVNGVGLLRLQRRSHGPATPPDTH
jgi:membrane protease YdiL (CAAX protease family)